MALKLKRGFGTKSIVPVPSSGIRAYRTSEDNNMSSSHGENEANAENYPNMSRFRDLKGKRLTGEDHFVCFPTHLSGPFIPLRSSGLYHTNKADETTTSLNNQLS